MKKLSKIHLMFGGVLMAAAITVILVAGVLSQGAPAASVVPQSMVMLSASNMQFSMNTITAKVGQPITIHFENDDDMSHAFAIDALNVYTDTIAPNQSATVTFTPQEVGSYAFRCPVFKHDQLGMVGTFEVIP